MSCLVFQFSPCVVCFHNMLSFFPLCYVVSVSHLRGFFACPASLLSGHDYLLKLDSQGLEERKMGRYCIMDSEFQFEKMKKFWRWMVVMCLYNNVIIFTLTEL